MNYDLSLLSERHRKVFIELYASKYISDRALDDIFEIYKNLAIADES